MREDDIPEVRKRNSWYNCFTVQVVVDAKKNLTQETAKDVL